MSATAHTITIRLAGSADQLAIARLTALDSAEPPAWPLLLGEIDGKLRAALSMANGAEIADPFFLTEQLLELLRAHAEANAAPTSHRGRLRAGRAARFGRRWAIARSI